MRTNPNKEVDEATKQQNNKEMNCQSKEDVRLLVSGLNAPVRVICDTSVAKHNNRE